MLFKIFHKYYGPVSILSWELKEAHFTEEETEDVREILNQLTLDKWQSFQGCFSRPPCVNLAVRISPSCTMVFSPDFL